jgi:hypothetical protein
MPLKEFSLPRRLHQNRNSHLIVRAAPKSKFEFSHISGELISAVALEALERSAKLRDPIHGVTHKYFDSFGELSRNQLLVGVPPSDICLWDTAAFSSRNVP